jgi:hypothetical protein
MGGRVWVPVVSGPLGAYAAGYGSWLAAGGYSRWAVSHRLWQLELLSRWLQREGMRPGDLTADRVGRFLEARRAAGCSAWLSARSTALPLGYLRGLGVVPVAEPDVAEGPVEELLVAYRRYLFEERGLAERTVFGWYEPTARLFLSGRLGPDGLGLERLSAADVSGFLAAECPGRSVSAAKGVVAGLRSLLRYLHVAGLIAVPLHFSGRCPGSQICAIGRSRAGWSQRRSPACWPVAIGGGRSAVAITRSCCCSRGWDYAPAPTQHNQTHNIVALMSSTT